jgi:hypothetical protein
MTRGSNDPFVETSNSDLTSMGMSCCFYGGLRRLFSVLVFHHIYRYMMTGDMRHYLSVRYSRKM